MTDPDRLQSEILWLVQADSQHMKGKLIGDDIKMIDMWKHVNIDKFFKDKIKTKFPSVYRVALKFLKKMAASSFQERVFRCACCNQPRLFGCVIVGVADQLVVLLALQYGQEHSYGQPVEAGAGAV